MRAGGGGCSGRKAEDVTDGQAGGVTPKLSSPRCATNVFDSKICTSCHNVDNFLHQGRGGGGGLTKLMGPICQDELWSKVHTVNGLFSLYFLAWETYLND